MILRVWILGILLIVLLFYIWPRSEGFQAGGSLPAGLSAENTRTLFLSLVAQQKASGSQRFTLPPGYTGSATAQGPIVMNALGSNIGSTSIEGLISKVTNPSSTDTFKVVFGKYISMFALAKYNMNPVEARKALIQNYDGLQAQLTTTIQTPDEQAAQTDLQTGGITTKTRVCSDLNTLAMSLYGQVIQMQASVTDMGSNEKLAEDLHDENRAIQLSSACTNQGATPSAACIKLATQDETLFPILYNFDDANVSLLTNGQNVQEILTSVLQAFKGASCTLENSASTPNITSVFSSTYLKEIGVIDAQALVNKLQELSPYYVSPTIVNYITRQLTASDEYTANIRSTSDYIQEMSQITNSIVTLSATGGSGMYYNQVSGGITVCPAGYYCVPGNYPLQCPAGYYCPEGTTGDLLSTGGPQSCSIALDLALGATGKYSPIGSSKPSDCTNTVPAGYYIKDDVITECPAGAYCDGTSPAYKACAIGTYNPRKGQSSCKNCPPGHYCISERDTLGAITAKPCDKGTYSATVMASAKTTCISCPPGTSCPNMGMAAPTPCPPGTYFGTPNNTGDCTKGPAGKYYSAPTSIGTTGFPVGATDTSKFSPCMNGTYCPAGSANPVPCPKGYYCSMNEVFAVTTNGLFKNAQNVCSAFGAQLATPAQLNDALTRGADWCQCAWTSDGNSSYPINTTLYPSNYIIIENGISKNASFYCGGPNPGIRQCASNNGTNQYYSTCYGTKPANGTPNILPFRAAYTAINTQPATMTVTALWNDPNTATGISTPSPCPAGRYGDTVGMISSICTGRCSAGYFCPGASVKPTQTQCAAGYYCVEGTTAMQECPAGSYCPFGTSSPIRCVKGTYLDVKGGNSLESCKSCPPGKFCDGVSNSADGLPLPPQSCPIGKYCPPGSYEPTNCPAGSYCPTTELSEPLLCPPGTMSDTTGASSKTTCQTVGGGWYSPNPGTTSLTRKKCTKGYYCPAVMACSTRAGGSVSILIGSTQPIGCPSSTYCDSDGMAKPTSCPLGQTTNITGATSVNQCTPCSKGKLYYTVATTGVSGSKAVQPYVETIVCTDTCPDGKYTPDSIFCRDCEVGSVCMGGTKKLCPIGTYAPFEGLSKCQSCPAGKTTSSAGAASCNTDCPAGQYSPPTGSGCFPCDPGKISVAGASECTACQPGQYSTNNITCTPCAAGTYSSTPGTTCSICPSGTYSFAGAAECTIVPGGYYAGSGAAASILQTSLYENVLGNVTYETVVPIPNISGRYVAILPPSSLTSGDGYLSLRQVSVFDSTGTNLSVNKPVRTTSTCNRCGEGTGIFQPGSIAVDGNVNSTSSYTTQGNVATFSNIWQSATSNRTAEAFEIDLGTTKVISSIKIVGRSDCCNSTFGNDRMKGVRIHIDNVSKFSIFYRGSAQSQCAAGQYSAPGSGTCTICPAGTYSAAGAESCTSCPAGTYSGTGATSCTADTSGYYSGSRAIGQNQCPAGYSCASGILNICPAGTFSPVGQTTCSNCAIGTYSQAGAISCTRYCGPGAYYTNTGGSAFTCRGCAAGTYLPNGANTCVTCPTGQYSPIGSTMCYNSCPTGYICDNNTTTATAATQAQAGSIPRTNPICPAGYDCTGPTPTLCAAGTYSLQGDQTCKTCPAGTYSAVGAMGCVQTPVGNYSGSGASSSSVCPGGFSCAGGIITQCPAGSFSLAGYMNCSSCPAGKFSTAGSSECLTCPAGTYSTGSAGACTPVADGYYTILGASSQIACTPGYTCQSTSPNTICPAGTYSSSATFTTDPKCKYCPAGTYSNAGASSCSQCSTGTYSQIGGGKGSCKTCPAGQVPTPDQSECIECDIGEAAAPGASRCSICGPGTYTSLDKSTCTPCPAGTYSTTDRATSVSTCIPCLDGMYSSAGSTSCRKCEPGKYAIAGDKSRCALCPAGTANSNVGSLSVSDCLTCAGGTYAPEGSSVCLQCPTYIRGGYYPLDDYAMFSSAGASVCNSICPAGYRCSVFMNDDYDIVNPSPPSICPANTYSPAYNLGSNIAQTKINYSQFVADGGLKKLYISDNIYPNRNTGHPWSIWYMRIEDTLMNSGPSYFYAMMSIYTYKAYIASNCTPCPTGTYSAEGSGSCSTIPEGFYVDPTSKKTVQCPPGSRCTGGKKFECDAGTYCPPGTTCTVNCNTCASGTYSLPGQAECSTTCPAGYRCEGSSTTKCLGGTYSTQGSGKCTECPANTYSTAEGATSLATCLTCPAGKTSGTGKTSCNDCSRGEYSTGSSGCIACPVGTYSSNVGTSPDSCLTCPAGKQCTSTGTFTPVDCLPGNYSTAGSACTACAAGTYSTTSGTISCTKCPAGTYQTTPGQQYCNDAGKGYYSPSDGAITHIICAAGTFSSGRAISCTPCPSGYSGAGASSCTDCKAGSKLTGSTACTPCPIGTSSSTVNSTTCSECWVGFYSLGGQPTCTACPVGAYCPSNGLGSYTSCPAGQTSPAVSTSQASCVPCAAGTYSASGVCQPCTGSSYSPAGAASCTDCTTNKAACDSYCNSIYANKLYSYTSPGFYAPAVITVTSSTYSTNSTYENGLARCCKSFNAGRGIGLAQVNGVCV